MKKLWLVFFAYILSLRTCYAVIYHLNASEYMRMPPLYGLDEYGSCLVPADGIYCVVRVDLTAEPGDELLTMIREYSDNQLKHYNHTYIQRGVCVKHTCKDYIRNNNVYTTEDLMDTLGTCLNKSIFTEYGLQGEVTNIYYCEKKQQQMDVDLFDWIVMGLFIAIAMVNLVGTLYHIIISRSDTAIKGNKYILSFSLIQNWNRLISAEPEEIRIRRLSGLHGIRVFTIFLMFTAHIMWVNSVNFNDNVQDFEESYDNSYYQMIFNGLVVVQVFFVVSGFLLVYNLEIHAEKHHISWGLAAKVWIMRWWRHIATDTQLFCVGLVVYLVTRRWGGRRIALGLLIALGVVLPAAHVWIWDLDALVLMTPEFYRTMVNDTFHHLHVYGHNNLACYALGMAAGYLAYSLQKKKLDITQNKVCIFLCWLIIPLIALLFYSGSVFYGEGARASLALRVAYAALQRPVIGVAVAFGVLGLAMGLKTCLRSLFEWRAWLVPSRLSYSVYLLHLLLIHTHIGLQRNMGHASAFNLTLMHFGVVVLTFMVSLPFSLMVEAPLMRLMKVAVSREEATGEQTKF